MQLPTVEIKEHPPEILELDEETVAIAKAKFAGIDLDGIYGDEDRSSSDLMVKIQAKKIRELFETSANLRAAFSSEQRIEQAMKDIMIDGIDLTFIKAYCGKRQWDFATDAEALIWVAFENERSRETND